VRSPDVVLCRGCCCGTDGKHPEVDHGAQRRALEAAARRSGARLVVADCLDACDRSNVVVVRPRGRGTPRPVWLGDVLDDERTSAVAAWASAGGPGAAPLPEVLGACVFTPTRHSRQELDEA
jgi:(2Fe-2S) ferredoxin